MTVTTTETEVSYVGDDLQTNFPFGFTVLEGGDITVYLDDIPLLVGVIVNLNPDQNVAPGGSVDITPAPASGVIVRLSRETPKTQSVDYMPYDAFPAQTHELALDRLTLLTQENESLANEKLDWLAAPATASDTGTAGQIAYDTDYFYVCIATDTWKRVLLETW